MEIRPPYAIVLPVVFSLDKSDEKFRHKIVLCTQIDDRSISGCMVNRLFGQNSLHFFDVNSLGDSPFIYIVLQE